MFGPVFYGKICSCLVNPKACHETEMVVTPGDRHRVAVIGAGVGGLAAAVTAAERGHEVTLFESEARIGGRIWPRMCRERPNSWRP